MKSKKYWPIDRVTLEVLSMCQASYRGGTYHLPKNALVIEPLKSLKGFAVVAILDDSGSAIGTKYIEDHRGITIYDESNCTKSEVVNELGPIKDGFTPDKPQTEFDERINAAWVTNQSKKYIHDYDQVDNVRRNRYSQICDPLVAEANIKRLQGNEAEAQELEAQALAAWQEIHDDHLWPDNPSS